MKEKTFQFWVFFLLFFLAGCSLIETNPPTVTDCECGEPFLDERDGQVYNTFWLDENGGSNKSLPGQCWMEENLRYIIEDGTSSFCFEDEASNCMDFGRLYEWELIRSGKKLCPEGWHIPSDAEWLQFEINIGLPIDDLFYLGATTANRQERGRLQDFGNKLIAESGVFKARLGGYCDNTTAVPREYTKKDTAAYFWTTTRLDLDRDRIILRILDSRGDSIMPFGITRGWIREDCLKKQAFCIRCLRN